MHTRPETYQDSNPHDTRPETHQYSDPRDTRQETHQDSNPQAHLVPIDVDPPQASLQLTLQERTALDTAERERLGNLLSGVQVCVSTAQYELCRWHPDEALPM